MIGKTKKTKLLYPKRAHNRRLYRIWKGSIQDEDLRTPPSPNERPKFYRHHPCAPTPNPDTRTQKLHRK